MKVPVRCRPVGARRRGPARDAAAGDVACCSGSRSAWRRHARAADGEDCATDDPDAPRTDPVTEASATRADLQIDKAQDYVREVLGREPGQGVTVAIVDSGVEECPGALDVSGARRAARRAGARVGRGTVVAGLVAGGDAPDEDGGDPLEIGIAPAATIQDVRVYDVATATATTRRVPTPPCSPRA